MNIIRGNVLAVSAALLSSVVGLCAAQCDAARAGTIVQYTAPADPTTEGFGTVEFSCCGSAAPLSNDLGLPAWSIGPGSSSWQFGYDSGALTPAEKAAMATNGFVLTVVARVLQGSAPAYSSGSPITIGAAVVDTGSVRWEIDLGLDASGDTVVVLPNAIDDAGPGGAIR
jgi:hypothetical protein